MTAATSDALVVFGITGDLAHKKLIPALGSLAARGSLKVPVIGVARSEWSRERLLEHVASSLSASGQPNAAAYAQLSERLVYVRGDYGDASTFERLCQALGEARHPLFYLAIPPSAFEAVMAGLAGIACACDGRFILEKPFGRDLASARALNGFVRRHFDESAVFRIDHYLGKEPVQNLLYFRFANAFMEPIWNRHYIAAVEINMAQSFGVEGRGGFYEQVGALRDVVQNHMFQVLALLAMEPPIAPDSESIRDENTKLLRSVRPIESNALVRGQYRGYRSERGVAPDSRVETFVAMRLAIDSWRWSGVPFLLRAGKHLPVTATEVRVSLRRPPKQLFRDTGAAAADNYFRFGLGPGQVRIDLGARVKAHGEAMRGDEVALQFCSNRDDEMSAHERLLGDAMKGDPTLFARQDTVEAAWRIVQPALEADTAVHPYEPGSWGPAEAQRIAIHAGGWHDPAGSRPRRSS
ncbi:MAG: glucose-6-phosphate dehydrogenase [Betaproteobacteria bacterium]|nr:MAG: glucose-6-phosphate dehydrogenase [Betaproteobacteria bacterium]